MREKRNAADDLQFRQKDTMIGMTLTRDIGARMAVRPPRPPEVPRSRAVGCKSPAYDDDEKSSTAWNWVNRWRGSCPEKDAAATVWGYHYYQDRTLIGKEAPAHVENPVKR